MHTRYKDIKLQLDLNYNFGHSESARREHDVVSDKGGGGGGGDSMKSCLLSQRPRSPTTKPSSSRMAPLIFLSGQPIWATILVARFVYFILSLFLELSLVL